MKSSRNSLLAAIADAAGARAGIIRAAITLVVPFSAASGATSIARLLDVRWATLRAAWSSENVVGAGGPQSAPTGSQGRHRWTPAAEHVGRHGARALCNSGRSLRSGGCRCDSMVTMCR